MSREVVECKNCGEVAGYFYPAKTYGDPSNCSPAEDTVEVYDYNDNPFCSEECLEEYAADHCEEIDEDGE